MSSRSTRTCWTISAFLFPLLFFVAAVNPYLLPEQYDNVLYYFGAQSLAETGSFKWEGYYIQNWPPVLSAMMAIPFALGLNSVAIGKLVVVLSVALTLTWGYRLFQLEGREHALLTFFFAGLLPAGFLMGTRIMSEWPYAALSMLFFILLYQMRYDRGMPLALLAGAVLGAASLTRWVGVLLGIALIAQAMPYVWNRRPKWRAVLPEFAAAVFGATIWAIWKAKLAYQVHMGTASANWYFDGSNFLAYFSVSAFWKTLGDLFFQSNSILSVAGLQNHPAALLLILPAAVTLLGLFWHFRYYRQPADWYVLATLVLFLCFRWKHTRYLVPLAPFLLFYFFMGISCLAHWTKVNIWRTWPCKLTLAGWAAALVMLNSYLLIYGNNRNHNGLSMVASPTPSAFYTGRWRELYQICQDIRACEPRGDIALKGEESKYIFAFSGYPCVPYEKTKNAAFVIVEAPEKIEHPADLEEIRRFTAFTLYRTIEAKTTNVHVTHLNMTP